jgi:hypothetical protein
MPEQIKSTFEEVIEIKLETKDFTDGINTLKAKWQEFKDELGADAGNVLGAGMLGDIQKGFNTLVDKLAMLNDEMQKQNADTVNNLKETVNKVLKVVEEGEQAKVKLYQATELKKEELQKKAADKEAAKAAKEAEDAKKFSGLQFETKPKFLRELENEGEGEVNKIAAEKDKQAARDKARAEKIVADLIAAQEKGRVAGDKYVQWWAGVIDKQIAADQKLANERDKQAAKDKVRAEKFVADTIAAQNKARKSGQEYIDWWTAALKKQDDLTLAQRKSAQDIAIAVEGQENDFLAKKQALLEKTAKAQNDADAAGFKRQLADTQSVGDRLKLINNRLAELKARKEALGKIDLIDPNDLEQIEAVNAALAKTKVLDAEIAALQGKANSLQKQSVVNIRSLGDELVKSLAITARFYASFTLIQGVLDLLAAPFLAIREGLKYAEETERAIVSLEATLLQNVKYSDDIAENFNEVKKQATAVVQELQDIGTRLNIKPETLNATFKALISGGLTEYVDTMHEAIDFTVQFQQALDAVGEGGLVAQASISQIRELLLGMPEDNSPFLRAIGLGGKPGEWIAIREEAKKTGDLIGTLALRFAPFRKQLEEAGKTQQALAQSTELTLKRVAELATSGLYKTINEVLQKINTLLREDSSGLVKALRTVANALSGLVIAIGGLVDSGAFTVLATALAILAAGLTDIVTILTELADVIVTDVKALFALFTGDTAGFKAIMDAFGERIAKAWKAIFGRTAKEAEETKADLDRKFGSQNGNIGTNPRNKSLILNELQTARKEFDNELEKLNADAERQLDAVKFLIEEGKLSATDAAKQIAAIYKGQADGVEELQQKLLKAFARAKEDSKPLKTTDPKDFNDITETLKGVEEDLSKKLLGIAEDRRKAINAANMSGSKERLAISKEEAAQERTLRQQERDFRVQLEKELADQGLQTRLDVFDRETQLLKEQTKDTIDSYQEQIDALADNREDREKLENELEKFKDKQLKNDQLRFQQRITLEREVQVEILKNIQSVKESALALRETENETLNILNPTTRLKSIQDAILKSRYDSLIPLRDAYQLQLDQLEAAGALPSEIAKTQAALNGVYNEQQKIINARLENAVAGVENGVIRQLILNQTKRDIDKENNAVTVTKLSPKPFTDAIFGKDTLETLKTTTGTFDKLAAGAALVAEGFNTVVDTINVFKQGFAQGGVLGGVGGVIGKFSQQIGSIPVVGPFISAIGGVLSTVGALFVRGAKVIATNIKQAFEKTMEDFRNGNVNLVDTLAALQRERVDAISRLSGKKGGKSELDKLLPEIDKSIADLLRQQKEILTNFESQLDLLRLQNNTLETARKNWQDINKQVKEYIDAGGDAAKAGEFLSLKLQELRQGYIDELNSAEQEAIQNALKLNDLLDQRNKIVADYKKQVFDLANADNIERRQAGSITRGNQIAQLKKDTDEKLAQIDREIKAAQARKDKEGEIFNLATDIADLHRRDEELSAAALDTQIDKLKTLKLLAEDITKGPNGLFASGGLLSGTNSINTNNFNITVNVTGVGEDIGGQVADAIMNEFDTRVRMGV